MTSKEKVFPDGIRFERPKEGAPEFVKGKLSFEVDKAIAFLTKHKNDKGWVNCDLLKSKEKGTLYLVLNDFKPKTEPEGYPASIDPNEIPF
jgi:hypothetical protein